MLWMATTCESSLAAIWYEKICGIHAATNIASKTSEVEIRILSTIFLLIKSEYKLQAGMPCPIQHGAPSPFDS